MSLLKKRWEHKRKKQNNTIFYGRDNLLEKSLLLYKQLTKKDATVIDFYGVGGIGKTTLLKHIKLKFDTKNIAVFYYDMEKHISVENFYQTLYQWLQTNGIKADYFQMAFLIYWQRLHPNIEFKDSLPIVLEEGGLFGDIVSMAFEDTFDLLKDSLPIVGSMSKFLYKGYKKLAKKYNLDIEIVSSISELSNTEIPLEEIESQLAYFFMHDLEKYVQSGGQAPLFMFDTYEKLIFSSNYEKKVRAQIWVENFAASLGQNGMMIIAGREKIDWKSYDQSWDTLLYYERLDALSFTDTKKTVEGHDIKDQDIVETIAKSSQGYPFYLYLLIETYKRSPEQFKDSDFKLLSLDEIFQRFIGNLNSEELSILEYLSIPRGFDKHLYDFILSAFSVTTSSLQFNNIISYSFLSQHESHFIMHDIMRNSFLKQIDKQKMDQIHKVIFQYYSKKSFYNNINNFALKEALYHLTSYGSVEEVKEWFANVKKVLRKQGEYILLNDLYISILNTLKNRELKIVLNIEFAMLSIDTDNHIQINAIAEELEHTNVPLRMLDFVNYIKVKKELNYFFTHSSSKFKRNINRIIKHLKKLTASSIIPEVKLRAFVDLAKIYRKKKEYYKAQSYLFSATKILDDNYFQAKIFDSLGYLHKDMKKYESAEKYFLNAIELKRKILSINHLEIGKSYRGMAQVLFKQKKIDIGKKALMESTKRFEVLYDKWSSMVFGEYLLLAKYEEFEIVKEQEEIDKELFLVAKIKILSQEQQEYKHILDMLKDLPNKSMQRYLKIALILIKDEETTQKYIQQALQYSVADLEKRHVFLSLYSTYMQRENYKEAKKYLLQLLEISKKVDFKKYIEDLQRTAYFYQKTKVKESAYNTYKEIESLLLNQPKYHKKLADIYHYIAKLFPRGDEQWFVYIQKSLELYKKAEASSEEIKIIEELIKTSRKQNNQDEEKKLLLTLLSIYQKQNNHARTDHLYGQLADFYIKTGNLQEAQHYYLLQIEIRKKLDDDLKLSKGYKFLADFVISWRHDLQKSEEYYIKGLQIILESKIKNYKQIELSSFALLKFYIKTKNLKKRKKLLDLRLQYALESNNVDFIMNSFKNLEEYYLEREDYESAIQSAKKAYKLISSIHYPLQKIEINKRLIKYFKAVNNQSELISYRLRIYEFYLLYNNFEDAQIVFETIFKTFQKKEQFVNFIETTMKKIFGDFIFELKYKAYSLALKDFKKCIKYKSKYLPYYETKQIKYNMQTMMKKHINKFINRAPVKNEILYKTYKELFHLNLPYEAAFFYDKYFDMQLSNHKGEFEKQLKVYEEAENIFKILNNQTILQQFHTRYEKFNNRLQKMFIVNGYIVDKILQRVITQCKPFENRPTPEQLKSKMENFIDICMQDSIFMERVTNNKMALSVLLQAIKIIVPNYNPLYFGFEKNHLFFSWILTGSHLMLAKNSNAYFVVERHTLNQQIFEAVEDIQNYQEYIHNVNNYAILLSKMFFDGDGLFFSKERVLDQQFYRYTSCNIFIEMEFEEILEQICNDLKIEKSIDKLRIQNLIMNLYYADLLIDESPFNEFLSKKFTLKVNGSELESLLKEYGFLKLKEILGYVNRRTYELLWV